MTRAQPIGTTGVMVLRAKWPDLFARLAVLLRMTWIAAKRRADRLACLETLLSCGRLRMPPGGDIDKGPNGTTGFAWAVSRKQPVEASRIIRGWGKIGVPPALGLACARSAHGPAAPAECELSDWYLHWGQASISKP